MKPTPSISSPVVPRSHRTASTNAPRPHALSKPELVEPRKRAASTNTLPARTSLKPRSVIPHSSETKKPEEVQKKELKAPSYNEDSILDQEIVQTRNLLLNEIATRDSLIASDKQLQELISATKSEVATLQASVDSFSGFGGLADTLDRRGTERIQSAAHIISQMRALLTELQTSVLNQAPASSDVQPLPMLFDLTDPVVIQKLMSLSYERDGKLAALEAELHKTQQTLNT